MKSYFRTLFVGLISAVGGMIAFVLCFFVFYWVGMAFVINGYFPAIGVLVPGGIVAIPAMGGLVAMRIGTLFERFIDGPYYGEKPLTGRPYDENQF